MKSSPEVLYVGSPGRTSNSAEVFAAAGLVTLYVGLILTLPLIGHATWHAYRDLVEQPGGLEATA